MSNELKHAAEIIHMAKHGYESVEGFAPKDHKWFHGTGLFNPITRTDIEWRIKPATITYTVTVPEPMRETLDKDRVVYAVSSVGVVSHKQPQTRQYDANDIVWDTEAKAQAAFDALFGSLKATK
jgi:hypothetical protein